MKRVKVLCLDDPLYRTCDMRVVIRHDDSAFWPPDEWDHSFKLWSRSPRMRSDMDAVSPFHENDDGLVEADDDKIVIPITVYDHGGVHFYLGDTAVAYDPGGWDTIRSTLFLYTDRETWESMHGPGSWSGTDDSEFLAQVRKEASGYVKEMNLAEDGMLWGYRVERKRKFVKTYEDGSTEEGHEWVENDSCWGFLTDEVDDIEFPKRTGLPVFSDHFAGDEYTVSEFVVCRKVGDVGYAYLRADGGWSPTIANAEVHEAWHTAAEAARKAIPAGEFDHAANVRDKSLFTEEERNER